jgi:hypothetical protein
MPDVLLILLILSRVLSDNSLVLVEGQMGHFGL